MISLLDVNVLIALAWPNHIHHRLASRWFDRNRKSGWATCPLTQSGFVRVSSNAHILSDAHGGRLATLDRAITHLTPATHSAKDAVCLVLD
jgi:predicted nucleic acid-binding protein